MRTLWTTPSPHALLRRPAVAGLGLLDGFQALAELDRSLRQPAAHRPKLRIRKVEASEDAETPAGWEAILEAPGVTADQVELQVERGVLQLAVKRELQAPEGMRALRRERQAWTLQRRLPLPDEVDEEAISATLRDGLLRVRLPLRAAPPVRSIPVTVEG